MKADLRQRRRAINIYEGDVIDEAAFKSLIRAIVEKNKEAGAGKPTKTKR